MRQTTTEIQNLSTGNKPTPSREDRAWTTITSSPYLQSIKKTMITLQKGKTTQYTFDVTQTLQFN